MKFTKLLRDLNTQKVRRRLILVIIDGFQETVVEVQQRIRPTGS
jgi:hypothetical protein